MNYRILAVDDEQDFLDSIRRGLLTAGFRNVRLELDAKKAAALFAHDKSTADVTLIDITMPGMNGVELLEHIKRSSPDTECIMLTAVNDAEVAVDCLKKGAYDYLVKPISKDNLIATLHKALEKKVLRNLLNSHQHKSSLKLRSPAAFRDIVTGSDIMLRVLAEAELHALSDIPILITGESGTGKDLLARAIHAASPRAKFPFAAVNIASLPETLFDAAFHGHAKGAFTGATDDRQGYLEMTHKGTLFLDEVGNIPLEFQMKLLRVLEGGEFIKLGTGKPQTVDVRFVAATNMDLEKLIAKGRFRQDFYYRLKGAWLHLPPLRERRGDIPLLIGKFLENVPVKQGSPSIDDKAIALLMEYDYPGNVRELKSIVGAAVNLARAGAITVQCLPRQVRKRKFSRTNARAGADSNIEPLGEVEKKHIIAIYDAAGKNKIRAAKLLGIGVNTLRRKLLSYGIG